MSNYLARSWNFSEGAGSIRAGGDQEQWRGGQASAGVGIALCEGRLASGEMGRAGGRASPVSRLGRTRPCLIGERNLDSIVLIGAVSCDDGVALRSATPTTQSCSTSSQPRLILVSLLSSHPPRSPYSPSYGPGSVFTRTHHQGRRPREALPWDSLMTEPVCRVGGRVFRPRRRVVSPQAHAVSR